MKLFGALLLLISCHQISAGVRKLCPHEVERLKNWTEDDKQNIWELSGQNEGDMVFEPSQRSGIISESYRWPNKEIPYELDTTWTTEEADWIKESLLQFTQYTCLTIRPKTDNDTDYVYVTAEDAGCWSYVGRIGGRQQLNLQKGAIGTGCLQAGTIVHEFLHSAGFYHQQSAAERDEYVEIVWDNIQLGTESNFNKYNESEVSSFGQPYDYGSVMHYSAYAFSDNGEKTIIAFDPEAELGQRLRMSDIDAAKVNIMYGCPE